MANQSDLIDMLINMSQQRFQQTNPIFQSLAGRSAQFLGMPQIAPQIAPQTPNNFATAQDLSSKFQQLYRGGAYNATPSDPDRIFRAADVFERIGSGAPSDEILNLLSGIDPSLISTQSPIGAPETNVGAAISPNPMGRLDVTQSPMFGALKSGIESQFGRAKQDILSTIPRGGQLMDALANLSTDKARFTAGAIGGLAQDELNRAFQLLGIGDTSAFGGTGNAANLMTQIQMANMGRQSAMDQAFGSGIGTLIGMGLGGAFGICWVAEELYGKSDERTHCVRYYVTVHQRDKSLLGKFCRLYKRHGKKWVKIIKRNRLARAFAKRVFDKIYYASKRELIHGVA